VAVRGGTMFYASGGLIIRYTGAGAHASQPENGKNPVYALGRLIDALPAIYAGPKYTAPVLCTPVYLEAGEQGAFGIAAGSGSLWLTCRGQLEAEMRAAETELLSTARALADAYGLDMAVERRDVFPETANDAGCVGRIEAACQSLGIPFLPMERPIRSSEDFGWFTKQAPGAIFMLGAGEDAPPIHTSGYDFCDGLIEPAVALFKKLAEIG
jgi:metal-dependent amidase/aminoacylase/carboxypeptidase family protein